MFEDLKLALNNELRKPLPGKEAQLRMAPEGRLFSDNSTIKWNASVAIIINYHLPNIFDFLLIKRPEYDGYHSGQVGFPGGKYENSDDDLIETSIRECHEEIGVYLTNEDLAGRLTSLYIPVSQYMVYPFVFLVKSGPTYNIDTKEVSYLIKFELKKLMDNNLRKKTEMQIMGDNLIVPYYAIKSELVWGATAMILSEFIEILRRIEKKSPGLI